MHLVMTNNFLTKSADIRLQITKARIRLIVASGVTGGKSRAQRFRINMKRAVIVSLSFPHTRNCILVTFLTPASKSKRKFK